MEDPDLKLATHYSDSPSKLPYIAGGLALAGIVAIVLIMTTGIAERLLPMNEDFINVLIPTAADGSEALALRRLEQKETPRTLIVEGEVANRTESTISGLLAVIQVNDRFRLPSNTVSISVEPAELEPNATATFKAEIALGENGLSGYDLQFRLPDDGPFVPHKDERPPQPPQETNVPSK
jgi:hypothetical protein